MAAIAYTCAAVLNLTHSKSVATTAERLRVPVSWQVPLGLVAGFAIPVLGTAAACGLVLYFLCASAAHIRARDTRVPAWLNWAAFFLLAVAALVVSLTYQGPW